MKGTELMIFDTEVRSAVPLKLTSFDFDISISLTTKAKTDDEKRSALSLIA